MKVLGYLLQDPSSDRKKVHSQIAVARADRVGLAVLGGADDKKQVRVIAGDLAFAARKVAEMYEQKTRDYSTEHFGVVWADVPEATPDADLPYALLDAVKAGTHIDRMHPRATINDFLAAANSTVAATPSPKASNTRDRVKPLRVPEGEELIRPNGETYLPRFVGEHTDVAALRAFRKARIFALLEGLPGTGKTAMAEAAWSGELITVQGHGDMTVAHLVGSFMPTPEGGWRWQDGPLTVAMQEGRPLLIDEIHLVPTEVQGVLHSATDGRGAIRLDDRPDSPMVYAADGFYVVGAYNPEGLGGAALPEAIVSRFPVQITVTTDYDAAIELGVPETFVTIARNLATKDREDRKDGGMGVWVPQMRELLSAKRLIDAGLGARFAAGAMLGQCPRPEDLATIAEVATQTLGYTVKPLATGARA